MRIRKSILALAGVCMVFATAPTGGPGPSNPPNFPEECHWEDANGHDVGAIITFTHPDTPESGGYTCTGGCRYMREDWSMIQVPCVAQEEICYEGNGVCSQLCECMEVPDWAW